MRTTDDTSRLRCATHAPGEAGLHTQCAYGVHHVPKSPPVRQPARPSNSGRNRRHSHCVLFAIRERVVNELLLNGDVRRADVIVGVSQHQLVIHDSVALRVVEGSRANNP